MLPSALAGCCCGCLRLHKVFKGVLKSMGACQRTQIAVELQLRRLQILPAGRLPTACRSKHACNVNSLGECFFPFSQTAIDWIELVGEKGIAATLSNDTTFEAAYKAAGDKRKLLASKKDW